MKKRMFMVVDTSMVMAGESIRYVKEIVYQVLRINVDVVSLLTYGKKVKWKSENLNRSLFRWIYSHVTLKCGGPAPLGEALKELVKKLAKCNEDDRVVALFVTKGKPTDDWESALDFVKESSAFKRVHKSAILLGGEQNVDILVKICGDKNMVITYP